ncbi:zonadhesin-like [Carcharodon carcharias]|uniref:zonadhesin-like n=1 Tax=Carcharodon carcharias TaxID=13397 RepID=UPI001B7E0E8D|nr:zonadhesin-like [Carcharodon carcharias]
MEGFEIAAENFYIEALRSKYGSCIISGDPHYITFDSRKFTFLGTCTYTLARNCRNKTGPWFSIEGKNEERSLPGATYLRKIYLTIDNIIITLMKNRRILLNQTRVRLPKTVGRAQLSQSGHYVVVQTDFGLQVQYDGNHFVKIIVSSSYSGQMCGLCGDFNGNDADDYRSPDGALLTNSTMFGDSWKTKDDEDERKPGPRFKVSSKRRHLPTPACPAQPHDRKGALKPILFVPVCRIAGLSPGGAFSLQRNAKTHSVMCLYFRCRTINPSPCEKDVFDKANEQCSLITDPTGPFRDCVEVVDPLPYFNNCVYDMCRFPDYQPTLCDQLQAYTEACQSAKATVHNWRTPDFCTPPCQAHSHYNLCANLCPNTCAQPNPSNCSTKCIEGCDCDPGYVLSDRKCVPLSDCGCSDLQGDYHMINESWYLPGCKEKCTCVSPKLTKCRKTDCSPLEICALLDGVYGCHPKGKVSLSASGDPHYKTFDRLSYDFMGNCTYTFTKLCQPSSSSSSLPSFNVETSNEHRGRNTRVSYVRAVHVDVYGHRVTLLKSRRVILDGRRVNLPAFVEDKLEIRVSGGFVALETDFGLRVRYDGNHHVDVTVPSSYAGQLCGLCGNYNGISSDDDLKPDGDDADSFKELGASWLVPGTDTQRTIPASPVSPDGTDRRDFLLWRPGVGWGGWGAGVILRRVPGPTGSHLTGGPRSRPPCLRGTQPDVHSTQAWGSSYSAGAPSALEEETWATPPPTNPGAPSARLPGPALAPPMALDTSKVTRDPTTKKGKITTVDLKAVGEVQLAPYIQCTHEDPPSDCHKDKFEEPWSCGIIKDPKGPFHECNKLIPPEHSFEDCVYDLSCGPSEEMASLCFALEFYATLCAQAGVPVTWRNKTFCPLNCPSGSHYEPCGTACPASCTDLSAPNDCSQPCVEGCVCDQGHVLSGDQCVPFSQCGCVDQERNYRPLGESWISKGDCTERCTCATPNNITCERWECGLLEKCSILDGVLDCHTSGFTSCHVAGDPHYYTFDHAMHTFMGTCTYTLVTVCNATMVTPFTVSAKNEERGLPHASYLNQVHIDVQGLRITMQKSRRLLLDRKRIRVPFEDNMKGVNIYSSGIYNVLETKFGLMVRFDGNQHLEIKLPNTYFGKVCGMCGNFNNNGADERLMPDGRLARNVTQFGNSWQVVDDKDPRCQSDDREDLRPMCTADEEAVRRAQCQELLSAKYQRCRGVIEPAPFIESCVYDLCMYAGMHSTLCDNIQSYVEACKSEGVDLRWRNSTFCPLPCQKDSHYTECASACPATCLDIYAPSTCESSRPCVEGCECNSGFVLSDDRCVQLADCGCVDYKGDYHKSGDSWLNEHCDTKCTCTKGNLRCRKHECNENSVCTLRKNGNYRCKPVAFETCLISGDPHYLTFDGLAHHFQGKGRYTLATTYKPSETLQPFNLEGKNQVEKGNKKISYLSAVYIDVYGHSIEFHKERRFLLDGERVRPPYKSHDGFRVYQKSSSLYLETDFGLSVTFDGRENADIIIPSLYKRNVLGLCGNYDGRFRNDFTLPDGTQASSLKRSHPAQLRCLKSRFRSAEAKTENRAQARLSLLSAARRSGRQDFGVDNGAEPETGHFVDCSADQLTVVNSTTYCAAIVDPQGPFRDCHKNIKPETFYQ